MKDLYRIGLILFIVPVSLILLGVLLAMLEQSVDFNSYNTALGPASLGLAGFLIMLHISIKYYYKEGRHEKPDTPKKVHP